MYYVYNAIEKLIYFVKSSTFTVADVEGWEFTQTSITPRKEMKGTR